jgi:hypothetical protein
MIQENWLRLMNEAAAEAQEAAAAAVAAEAAPVVVAPAAAPIVVAAVAPAPVVVAAAVAPAPVVAPVGAAPVARDLTAIKSRIIDDYSFNRLRNYDDSNTYENVTYENFMDQQMVVIQNLSQTDYNFMNTLSLIINRGKINLVDGESCSNNCVEGIYFNRSGVLCIMSSR